MMVPGDCVIGLPDDGVALEYTLEAKVRTYCIRAGKGALISEI